MKLTWQKPDGGRGRRSISTGLPVKGNKRRAEDMLRDACQTQGRKLMSAPSADSLLFADFMEQWLEEIKPNIRASTYGGYWQNTRRVIVPYFRPRGITLQGLTAEDINKFYAEQIKRVKAMSVTKYHANIHNASIEHTVVETSVEGKKVIIADDTTKSKSSNRTLPLIAPVRARLLEIRREQDEYKKLCGRSYNTKDGQYIYVDPLGNLIRPAALTRDFPKFMETHGFRRMRLHDLRHSCASLLLASGVPLKQIQEWLGHSDFAITANTYAHLEFDSKLKSADAMTWIDRTALAHAADSDN
ncbi:MAG: site-specific integrase [Oscillospiraceae bacterium]|nr:site-specific integrase [Oscillospiraceae bacterium]